MVPRFCFVLFLMTLWCGALAQKPSSIATETQLTVRVTYDNDRAAPANLRVVLGSAYGSIVDTRMTDGYGSVTFTHLVPGKYKVIVSGSGVVTAQTGELDLTDAGPNATEYVRVHKIAGEASNSSPETSVTELQIPDKAKKEFDKGSRSLEKKDWDGAKSHFEQALVIYPKYAAAEGGLGMAYVNLGQGEKAVATFHAALAMDERLQAANLYLGHFYYDNRKFKEAEPFLTRAAAADPQNAQILTVLANTQVQNGEPELALNNARKVHSLPDHKKFAIAHLIAADILNGRKQYNEVASEYELFLKEDPHSPLAPNVREALAKLHAGSH